MLKNKLMLNKINTLTNKPALKSARKDKKIFCYLHYEADKHMNYRSAENFKIGILGEEFAEKVLKKKGWKILARNWRPEAPYQSLELDIVAQYKKELIFVEVKTRDKSKLEQIDIPIYTAFSIAKQRKVIKASQLYISKNDLWSMDCRFDLICVYYTAQDPLTLEHYEYAIENWQALGGSDSSWQPW